MKVEFALNILREAPIPMKNQEIFQVMKDQGFTGKKYEVRNFLWSLIDKGVKYRSSPYYDYQIAESVTIPNNVKKSIVKKNSPSLPLFWVKFDSRSMTLIGYINPKTSSDSENLEKIASTFMDLKLMNSGSEELDQIILDFANLYGRS